MAVWTWDTVAANNDDADATINWAESQAPSTVNNSARAMMAALAAWLKDISGAQTAGGTADALTLTTVSGIGSHTSPRMLTFEASATNTGAATITIDGLASRDIKRNDGSALQAGDVTTGGIYMIAYESGIDDYLLLNPTGQKLAAQSDMETGTSTVLLVTPGLQHHHPAHPKFWAYVTVSGGTPTLQTSHNVTSITDSGTGILTVTIATDFSSANWCCNASVELVDVTLDDNSDMRYVALGTKAAGTIQVQCFTEFGGQYSDPAGWNVSGMGDHA